MKHRNRLPRDVADASSLKTFKVMLEGALSILVKLKKSLLISRVLHYMDFNVPFNPNCSRILSLVLLVILVVKRKDGKRKEERKIERVIF